MSNEQELVSRIAASLATDSQEQPETIEAEAVETEEEVEAGSDSEVGDEVEESTEGVEGVEEDGQELTGSDDDDELYYEIEGKEYSASEIAGWKNNGLMQKAFTQKTQKLAEDRKAMESENGALKAELKASIAAVRDLVKVEGDWESGEDGLPIYDEDMGKYQRALVKQQGIDKLLSDAGAQTVVQDTPEHIAQENTKILAAIPSWEDEAVRGKDITAMTSLLNEIGFNGEGRSYDSAIFLLAYKAMMGDKISESGAEISKKRKAAPKIVKPKQARQAAKQTQLQEAKTRFKKSGGKNDRAGIELFKQFV
jgi:hypothetical protein